MRGHERNQTAMFSYVDLEERIPPDHPLRRMKALVEPALAALSGPFEALYAAEGRPSIPPEQLLRALILQALYSIRSERQLMEQLDYNLLFRWFVGLGVDDAVWVPSVFSKNRDRLLAGDVAQAFLSAVLDQAREATLLSSEHFTVDGTLVQAWASHKSFRPAVPKHRRKFLPPDDERRTPPAGRNSLEDFSGQPRSNTTHRSTTDPDARLAKRAPGQEARLAYQGHVLMENRTGLAVEARVTLATGTAERETAVAMVEALPHRREQITVGADKGYDTRGCVAALRHAGATPHVAQCITPRHPSAVDGRTTRHAGYRASQRQRKRVEQIFAWVKTVALQRQTKYRGLARVSWMFTFATAVYNLVRLRTLILAGGVA